MRKLTLATLLAALALVTLPAAVPAGGDEPAPVPVAPAPAPKEDDEDKPDPDDLIGVLAALEEDVDDLLEPIEEFDLFDQCMFMVGVRENAGYSYTGKDGRHVRRAALAMDMAGAPELAVGLPRLPGRGTAADRMQRRRRRRVHR